MAKFRNTLQRTDPVLLGLTALAIGLAVVTVVLAAHGQTGPMVAELRPTPI